MAAFNKTRRQVLALLGATAMPQAVHAATQVDLALVLAIDCSYSVDATEFQLQLRGTGQALLDSKTFEAISRGPNQKIAISVFLWSDPQSQFVMVPWHLIARQSDATEVADILLRVPRNIYRGTTATGSALLFAKSLLETAPPALRRVVDVSTDGVRNTGAAINSARDALIADGITINGLAIENEIEDLSHYMIESVIGGDGHFIIRANDYDAYAEAIKVKLLKEIANANLT